MAQKAPSKKRRKKSVRSGGGLAAISLSDLRAELQRRQRAAMPLLRRRARLVDQLGEIDTKLAAHGVNVAEMGASAAPSMAPAAAPARGGRRAAGRAKGARKVTRRAGGRRGPRGGNEMNLVEALQKLLDGKQMAVKDIVPAVQEAGYKTSSPNFRTIVNQALTANPSVFKKVSRGVYTAK